MRAGVAVQLASLLDTQDIAAELPLLALALREAEGDVRLRAEIHDRIAFALIEDTNGAQRHAHIASGLAERTGDQQLIAETLASSISGDFWAGEGLDHDVIGRGLELEERLPALSVGRSPTSMYAFALKWSGEVERARPLYERLRARGHATGDPGVVDILFFSAFHELISEDWEQAARHGEEAWRLAVDFERETEVAAALWAGAWVSAYRGEVERTRTTAAEAHRLALATGLPDLVLSGPPLGVLELSVTNAAQALAALRPSTQEKRAKGTKEPGLMLGFPEHVEAAVVCGELDEASELLDFVEEHARRLDRPWALACCARGRALLATARGEVAAAERAFAVAYEQHARRPQQLPTYELARTLLVHGSILRRRQQKRRAREALEQAFAIFDRLGARVYAERAHSELARIGGRTAAAGENLSETERQIADLVAEGRTNKEVAAALSLSPKTVEWNLSKVYAKLGVRSRAELASRRPLTQIRGSPRLFLLPGARTVGCMTTFMVERFVPGVAYDEFAEAVQRAATAAATLTEQGAPVRYLGSVFVPDEESSFCCFEARHVEAVREANRLADIQFWRVVRAVFINRSGVDQTLVQRR